MVGQYCVLDILNHFDLDMCFAPQCGALFRHLISENDVVCTFWLEHAGFLTYILPKLARTLHFFSNFGHPRRQKGTETLKISQVFILAWKPASCQSGVQFFHIPTSKNGPMLMRFLHFELKMRFTPRRRTILRHLNSKTSPKPVVF